MVVNNRRMVVIMVCLTLILVFASISEVMASTVFRTSPSTTQRFYLRGSSFISVPSRTTNFRIIIRPTQPDPQPQPTPQPTPQPEPEPPVPTPPPTPEPPSGSLTADEQRMVDLINAERTRRGLNPVQVHEGVVEVARAKSQDMITNNYFSHQSPTYGSPFEMLRSFGVSFVAAGENLAGNSTVNGAHTALMNSTGHRNNILNSRWTHVGVGVVSGGPFGKMHTQIFIRR